MCTSLVCVGVHACECNEWQMPSSAGSSNVSPSPHGHRGRSVAFWTRAAASPARRQAPRGGVHTSEAESAVEPDHTAAAECQEADGQGWRPRVRGAGGATGTVAKRRPPAVQTRASAQQPCLAGPWALPFF